MQGSQLTNIPLLTPTNDQLTLWNSYILLKFRNFAPLTKVLENVTDISQSSRSPS